MKTLVLGGGWVGARYCLLNPSACIATTRSEDKLSVLKSLGIEAVEFDLAREETWSNLPPKDEVSATTITFPLSKSQVPHWDKLLAGHIAVDKPLVCLGTTSVFQVGDHESVVNENTALIDTAGSLLADRSEGEKWVLSKGAAVLHLSGIVGDHDEGTNVYGTPRSIHLVFQPGRIHIFRNGLQLMNVVHVKDICKIVALIIDKFADVRGERLVVSCGAFRGKDLAKGLSLAALPDILPPDESMKGSKILSTAKLCSLLPAEYEWTLPVPGVEPVSRGLPAVGNLTYFPNCAARNRQWELFKHNFLGKWQGRGLWYDSDDHTSFVANLRSKELPPPSKIMPEMESSFYSLDADTVLFRGKGFRISPGGERKFSRTTFDELGHRFLIGQTGGQCSVDFKSSSFGMEINFFHERSRSMIVVLYKPGSTSGKFFLDRICIAPFRCGLGCSFPLKPLQTAVRRSVSTLLAGLSEKTCRMQWMSHSHALDETDGGEVQTMPTRSMLLFEDSDSRLVQSFDDDLVCSVPLEVAADQDSKLVFGCRHTDHLFQAVTVSYSNGKLDRNVYERWD